MNFSIEANESLAAKGRVIRTCLNLEPYVRYEQLNNCVQARSIEVMEQISVNCRVDHESNC